MDTDRTFYLCPICFEAFEADGEHHGRPLVRCDAGESGDERRKPVICQGRLASRAPRWFLKAIGSLPIAQSLFSLSGL